MIAYLEGRILERTEGACVVLTGGGVGYEVNAPARILAALPGRGGSARFFTCTVVREDALELYGFDTWDERETFLVLISINRVGARTALAILSVFRPDDLRRLVLEEDILSLTRVPGIGKKTGQQIFLELKYKLGGGVSAQAVPGLENSPGGVFGDVAAGLENLGYDHEEAVRAVRTVLAAEPDLDAGGALRAALRTLAAGRK
ncbi:MAG: Holliday junction branch migration protein RuvA [Deltaproteobacteria bacterium]|jgi:Holliday junction DNA helicase RuvA|nr:Holliday junction branch migration protein RuvA [Deltaproteobacteria bacterium]